MKQALIDAFEYDISNCLQEVNNTLIEVFDCYDCSPALQRSYIKTQEDQPVHFELSNPSSSNLTFAALDNCILKSVDLPRCDFVIGNFQKLYFVEIKQAKTNQRSRAKTDAARQLGSSLSLFRNKIDLSNSELVAVICLDAKQVRPLTSATSIQKRVAFKDDYNADLMEGQSHTF